MFRLLAIAILGFSLNANAAGKWKQVEENRIPLFKGALAKALRAKTFECYGTITEGDSTRESALILRPIATIIHKAQEFWLSEDLNQPIIFAKAEEKRYRTTFRFTTTADRKSITKIDIQQIRFKSHNRNIGTIDAPFYQYAEVVLQEIHGTCQ